MSRKQIAVAVAISTLMLVVLWAIAMGRGLNVDEHQFVASGALLAREGLLPYRDYPFFHTPDLSFVYALLFRCTDYFAFGTGASVTVTLPPSVYVRAVEVSDPV